MVRCLAAIAAVGLLHGCAAPLRVAATADQRASITELEARVVVLQDEVLPGVQGSNSIGAGAAVAGIAGMVVAGAIDHLVIENQMKVLPELAPLYAAIEDLDFRQRFGEAIGSGIAGYPIKVVRITTTPVALTQKARSRAREALAPGQALMVVAPRYLLGDDFRTLEVQTWVTIWRPEGEVFPVHRALLHYRSASVGSGGKESVALWSADRGAAFRVAIGEAIAETIALLHAEFRLADGAGQGEMRLFALQDNPQELPIKGWLISETPTRTVVLASSGALLSLPKPRATPSL
jgi:RNase P/RNase MRP subunit p29